MPELPFELKPLAETFGVEITGLSLREPLTDHVLSAMVHTLAYHSMLLVRTPGFTDAEQVAFTTRLGQLRDQELHSWAPKLNSDAAPTQTGNPGRRPVMNRGDLLFFVNGPGLSEGAEEDPHAVWNEEDGHYKGKGTSSWHTGDTEKVDVEVVNCLYAEVAARKGGDTLFCDTAAAYDTLPPDIQRKVDGLRAIHFFTLPKPTPPVSQALVKQNPISGRKFLYLNYFTIDRLEGLDKAESDALLKQLYQHQFQPRFIYTHKWQDGDFIVWNCNGTMHKRGALVSGQPRVLRRTQAAVPALQSTRPWDKTRVV